MVYLKVQAVPNFRGRTTKRWAKRSLARTATVMTDGMPSFNAIGEVIKDHQPIVMEGGWRNSVERAHERATDECGDHLLECPLEVDPEFRQRRIDLSRRKYAR